MNLPQFLTDVKQFDCSCSNSISELLDLIEENLEFNLVLINHIKKEIKSVRKLWKEQQDEIGYLEMQNESKDQQIKELGSLVNPYSSDGEAICNSDSH